MNPPARGGRGRVALAATVVLAGCYVDRLPESRYPGPPGPETYGSIPQLEREAVRPLASDVRVRLVEEGTTAGVEDAARRGALLAERRGQLYRGPSADEVARLAAEEAERWRSLARFARVEDLEGARAVWGDLEAGCTGCHDRVSIVPR